MLLGGFETARISLIAISGVHYALIRRRRQVPSRGLRVFGSAQCSARIPLVDVEIDGVESPADKTCILIFGAGNPDPSVFPEPDTLDISRSNARQHLAFAVGKQYCLGQALARLEGRIALQTLASRFPEAELAIDPADVVMPGMPCSVESPHSRSDSGRTADGLSGRFAGD